MSDQKDPIIDKVCDHIKDSQMRDASALPNVNGKIGEVQSTAVKEL
jgi:hypothetical protein